jgi:murein DD-endopeptidase MepM/ murein hydrolase activator NlpD
MRKAVLAGVLVLAFGPASLLLAIAVLLDPAAHASCGTSGSSRLLTVESLPDQLTATTADGVRVQLTHRQLTRAATIIEIGGQTDGVGTDGVTVALMAALAESSLRMLPNTSAYPSSAGYPSDGNGSDHDSMGLFQMRPSTGWGTVGQLMDATYQARAFYGGPTGPNHGAPRGLLDIRGWRDLPEQAAAQAVEVSAFPDRYARWQPVAATILDTLTGRAPSAATQTNRVVFPLPANTWTRTSGFGMRVHPITGMRKLHTGVDLAAPSGTPILAAADGRVVFAGPAAGYGNLILIEHTVNGQRVSSGYAHMFAEGIHVTVGDIVTAGQHIADVGAAGDATGAHLHFEIRSGGATFAPVDPEPWLASHGAASLEGASAGESTGCGNDPSGAASSQAGTNLYRSTIRPATARSPNRQIILGRRPPGSRGALVAPAGHGDRVLPAAARRT